MSRRSSPRRVRGLYCRWQFWPFLTSILGPTTLSGLFYWPLNVNLNLSSSWLLCTECCASLKNELVFDRLLNRFFVKGGSVVSRITISRRNRCILKGPPCWQCQGVLTPFLQQGSYFQQVDFNRSQLVGWRTWSVQGHRQNVKSLGWNREEVSTRTGTMVFRSVLFYYTGESWERGDQVRVLGLKSRVLGIHPKNLLPSGIGPRPSCSDPSRPVSNRRPEDDSRPRNEGRDLDNPTGPKTSRT